MLKKTILFIGLCLSWYRVKAQTIIILNEEDKQPVKNAILLQEHPIYATTSTGSGQATLTGFDLFRSIEISAPGFESRSFVWNQNLDTLFLRNTTMNLSEILISATRWHESSKNIPNQTTSISSKDIALNQPQTAADLLGTSGKIFIQKSQQGGGSPMIRGFAANRLIYTIDGVRMNTAIFRAGNLQNVINLDPFSTERTEVIFGPSSVIYGSDALGGVMSFQTLRPELATQNTIAFSGRANSRFSSANNERTGHLDFNIGLKQWAFLSSITFWDYDHLQQGTHGPDDYLKSQYVSRIQGSDSVISQQNSRLQIPSGYQQVNLMQKVIFKPSESWEFRYAFHHSQTSDFGRYDRHLRVRRGLPRYAEWDYGPQTWTLNMLQIHHTKSMGIYDQMSMRWAIQQFEESRIERSLNSPERTTQKERVHAYSVNWDFSKSLGKDNSLFYGVEGILNEVYSTGFFTQINTDSSYRGPSRYPHALWRSIGIYITDEHEVNDRFTLRSGLRYNLFGTQADFSQNLPFYPFPFERMNSQKDALTGSLGMVYKGGPKWLVRGNIGTAFRAPNVDDMGKIFDNIPGAITMPNTALKAEYAYNGELGFAYIFKHHFKIEGSAYYTYLHHALVRRDFTWNGADSLLYQGERVRVQAIQNAAHAIVYGFHTGVEWNPLKRWSVVSDINVQTGTEEMDNGEVGPSRHAAPWFGVTRVRYKHGSAVFECNVQYQGERTFEDLAIEEKGKVELYAKDAQGRPYAPSWVTLNLKVHYECTRFFTLNTGIENITDQRYRPYSSGISAAGRNFYASLKIEF
jgi:hemoglobin/transferrin/lactoferrin receptor protein